MIVALSLGSTIWSAPEQALPLVPAHGLVLWFAWAVLWNPRVEIAPEDVTIVNILRTHRVPFTAIEDVQTRWGLSVTADGRRYPAWAAPAPGVLHTMRVNVRNYRNLPEARMEQGTARLSDDPGTDSGAAAVHIHRGIEAQSTTGTDAAVQTRWHPITIALGLVCIAGTALWALL